MCARLEHFLACNLGKHVVVNLKVQTVRQRENFRTASTFEKTDTGKLRSAQTQTHEHCATSNC